ncbi:MAG: OprO/OprP family phosphate-selective porin [Proteobacteria bacterium]|jgi:hypothetical protein|nr:OprO/OprP family phosphate-selective porin [Pseudomonadota bacterium]
MKRKLHIAPVALFVLTAAFLQGRTALGQEPVPQEAEPAPAAEPAPVAAPAPPPVERPGAEITSDGDGADGGVAIGESEKIKIGGRVHAGYRMTREAPSPAESGRDTENEFMVRRARLKLNWRPERWMLAVIQIDVAEALQLGGSILRDAYVHLSPLDQLQIRIGQFKKPFSGLELQSPAKLRVIDRGPGVDYIVEDLLYGDRDLGLQLSGRLVKSVKLDYEIGVFNGSGPEIEEMDNSKDLVARVQIRPVKQLELGLNGSAKFFSEPDPGEARRSFAGGGDARVQVKGFRLYAEGLVAGNHREFNVRRAAGVEDSPFSFVTFAVIGMVSYRHKFDTEIRFAIEPAFKAELFDPDTKITEDHLWVLTPGVNTYIGKYFKLMIGGEFVRSNRNSPIDHPDSEALEVLACFDI